MADPISLYRFLDSDAALKTLEAGRFRVGELSKFNDPFEWNLGVAGGGISEAARICKEFL
jgi:hypothetical protein